MSAHKEFIQYSYGFRVNLQRVKDHHDSKNYPQAKCDAIASFKKMIEIANQEASGNGNLRHDFQCWLLWNYDLNQEHSSVLIDQELGFGAECVFKLMSEIRDKKETNKKKFINALIEYNHVKETLARRIVRSNHAQYVINYFSSILRNIIVFDTIYMYSMYKDQLGEELIYIAQRIRELGFSQLAISVESNWKIFEENIQVVNTAEILQREEINTALELSFLNPVLSPIDSVKNIIHVICHPSQIAKVAWEWVRENPGKTAVLVVGTLGISLAIGAVVGVVGTALCTGTSIFSVTAADFIVGGAVSSLALTTTTLTAIGGKAARESTLTASNAVDAEIMLRQLSLNKLNREEEQYRKQAREAMRKQRQENEIETRGTSYELVNTDTSNSNIQYEPFNLDSDSDRLLHAAQDMQFAKEDVSRELVATYQQEQTLNERLDSIIQKNKETKEEIKQNQTDAIKTAGKN
ncbi:hypothetical protein I4U23_027445 [Adineta vaga]|nr:hypothetical protein I4U23_027445 [Adineta vaga]